MITRKRSNRIRNGIVLLLATAAIGLLALGTTGCALSGGERRELRQEMRVEDRTDERIDRRDDRQEDRRKDRRDDD